MADQNTRAPLNGKTALITGASRGLGKVIALRLAADGAQVVVNYRSGEAEAREVVHEVEAAGGKAIAVQADVVDSKAVADLFDQAETVFGGVDIVVANAGVELIDTPITEIDDEAHDRVTRINVYGTFYTLREAAAHVRDGGRVIVISSTTTIHTNGGFTAYAGSKAAGKTYVECLAQELGSRDITVNSVIPGPLGDAGVLLDAPDDAKAEMSALSPFGRMGRSEDIDGVVAFVAGPNAGWISGQHITANGAAKI